MVVTQFEPWMPAKLAVHAEKPVIERDQEVFDKDSLGQGPEPAKPFGGNEPCHELMRQGWPWYLLKGRIELRPICCII